MAASCQMLIAKTQVVEARQRMEGEDRGRTGNRGEGQGEKCEG